MYQEYWGLEESPFHCELDPQYFFKSGVIEEALARLHFLVNNRYRLGLLTGASGLGKTALLGMFGSQLRRSQRQVIQMNLLGIDQEEFVVGIARQMGESRPENKSLSTVWRCIHDRLAVNRYQQVETVYLLDDAHDAEHDVLTAVARLAHWQPTPDTRLTIVLSTDRDRSELLGRRLLELCELRVELWPWESNDTAHYVKTMVLRAGRRQPAFDVTALERIHALAGGMPRRIRQLAELALVAGAGQQLHVIDVDTVASVHDELSVSAVSALP